VRDKSITPRLEIEGVRMLRGIAASRDRSRLFCHNIGRHHAIHSPVQLVLHNLEKFNRFFVKRLIAGGELEDVPNLLPEGSLIRGANIPLMCLLRILSYHIKRITRMSNKRFNERIFFKYHVTYNFNAFPCCRLLFTDSHHLKAVSE
jgi:hypothetical protein